MDSLNLYYLYDLVINLTFFYHLSNFSNNIELFSYLIYFVFYIYLDFSLFLSIKKSGNAFPFNLFFLLKN